MAKAGLNADRLGDHLAATAAEMPSVSDGAGEKVDTDDSRRMGAVRSGRGQVQLQSLGADLQLHAGCLNRVNEAGGGRSRASVLCRVW